MRTDLRIRPETPQDADAVATLLDAAFPVPAAAEYALESELLLGLRSDGDVLPELTFVAELDDTVVGVVVCSRATMGQAPSIGLGPLAVHPDHQGQGIGSALVAAVVVTADQRGEPALVLLGDPGYYAIFGFRAAAGLGVGAPGPWGEEELQVRTLQAWRPELAGAFRYAPAFERLGRA